MSITGIGPSQGAYTPPASGAGSSLAGAQAKASGPEAEFMKWAKMTPAERMRANFLAGMGLDEDKVAAMSPQDRQKVEDKLRELIEAKIKQGDKTPGQRVDKTV